MVVDKQLNQLSWQLEKHGSGAMTSISAEVMSRLGSAISMVIASLRQAAQQQPLMAMVLAGQAGYLVARWGRRDANN